MKIVIVVLYIAVMLLVGWLCMGRNKTVSDFFLGGRNIGPWLSAFAYGSTYFSAVLFIGYAGKLGWGFGLHTMWIVAGNAFVGVFLAWKILGPRTRRMTDRLGAMTMPEFLAARYNSRFLKIVSAIVIFAFLVPYTASVYMGLSYLFEVNLQIPYAYALAFMAILTGVYLIMGGYLAVLITDLIQGVVVLIGVAIMVTVLVSQAGGFGEATRQLMAPEYAPGLLAKGGIPGWVTLASLVLITSLGPWGMPQMVQKFYSIKDESSIQRAALVCTAIAVVMTFGAYYTGALTHLFYQTPPANIDELIPRLLTEHTPAWVAMVILLLVISASMSSLSSLVLVSSSAIVIDLIGDLFPVERSKGRVVMMMRVCCGVFVALSLYTALMKPAIIVNLMVISWGALAGSFIGPYVYGLFWKRTTRTAAITGLLAGLGISIGLSGYLGPKGIPLAGAIAMLTPILLIPVVSLITRPFENAFIERIFGDEMESQTSSVREAVTEAAS
ncbi:MAG: sodium/solute symporter [bacterium]|nr:sodium/solute symporter [bacterium]